MKIKLETNTEKVTSMGLQWYKEAIFTLLTASGTINSKKIIPARKVDILKYKRINKPTIGKIICLNKEIFNESFQFAVRTFT